MFIKSLTVGLLGTNCYIVACEKSSEAIVIDPGFTEDELASFIQTINHQGLKIKFIVNTHGHVDHICGNERLKKVTGAKIAIHEKDADMLTDPSTNLSGALGLKEISPPTDVLLIDGDTLEFGSLKLRVLHTPGHTRGSICLHDSSNRVVFTGDTLFAGSIGRTDLPGASFKDIMRSIRDKLMVLPDETVVYPGHGEATTIGKERVENPFCVSLRG